MSKKQSIKPPVEKHEISGHQIEIRKTDGKEQLFINGVRCNFFVTSEGYTLRDDAYVPPYRSLVEAVKSYLEKTSQQPEQ